MRGPSDGALVLAAALGLLVLPCPNRAAPPAIDGQILRYNPEDPDLHDAVITALIRYAAPRYLRSVGEAPCTP